MLLDKAIIVLIVITVMDMVIRIKTIIFVFFFVTIIFLNMISVTQKLWIWRIIVLAAVILLWLIMINKNIPILLKILLIAILVSRFLQILYIIVMWDWWFVEEKRHWIIQRRNCSRSSEVWRVGNIIAVISGAVDI